MTNNSLSYQIKLAQFEGPFDLLLFFIERDELDIYNIPITKITDDFLEFIHHQQTVNIELSSEFILFISTLMRIKAKMLLPRKELDAQGNELDPRQELINKILEYKKFKEASAQMVKIGEESSEGTEIQTVTMFRLMRAFERVMQRYHDTKNKPVHTVIRYEYTMEGSRDFMLSKAQEEKTLSFEKIFGNCDNRVHAIFLFLSLLELVQQKFLKIVMGEGKNNFIIEYNEPENRLAEMEDQIQPQ